MCRIKKTNTKYKKNHNAYRLCSSDYMKYFNETDIDQAKQLCVLSAKRALHPTSIEADLMLQATRTEIRGMNNWSACQWRYAAKPDRCVSQGEILEINKALEIGYAALRRLDGWVVLTDVIMNAIPTLCTSTEPSCQETQDLVQYPYHISVCDHQNIWRKYTWERHQMYRLQNLYTTNIKRWYPCRPSRA